MCTKVETVLLFYLLVLGRVIFHLIPYLFQQRSAIVVAPISALMEDQLLSLSEMNISACSFTMDGSFFNIVSR